jgi:nucleotide-binding universal stress UspA family protein
LKQILVASDFSERSNRAVRRARLLAQEQGAHVLLLHVVDDDRPPRLVAGETAAARELLEQAIGTMLHGVHGKADVALGDPFDRIAKIARDIGADLIVMGAHRRQLLKNIFVGTSIERVIRENVAPVLMVNSDAAGPYQRVLVAVDMSEQSAHALQVARALRILHRAQVVVVHAFDSVAASKLAFAGVTSGRIESHRHEAAELARAELAQFLAALELGNEPYELRVKEGRAARVIREVAIDTAADIVVMGTHGRTGIPKLLLGSVTDETVCNLDRDVLVVPPRSHA